MVDWFKSTYPEGSIRSIDTVLQKMVNTGGLERTGYGQFRLRSDVKTPYIPIISSEMKELYSNISERYPYTKFCIWQARVVSSFMQHIPNIDVLILETARTSAEAVYEDIREIASGRTVLLCPTEKEFRLYASGTPSLLVKNLHSESPVMQVNGLTTARLEKILVDITITPEFEYARNSELFTIFENADQMYRISKKTMLRYASRRGKKEELKNLIDSTML
ncbi:MAG: DUF6577 family protein [Agathobacter sp.]